MTWWLTNRLAHAALGHLISSGARAVLGEKPLPHEAWALDHARQPVSDAKQVLEGLYDLDTTRPYTLISSAESALRKIRAIQALRSAKVAPSVASSPDAARWWLKQVFGMEYHYAGTASHKVEWAWRGAFPPPDTTIGPVPNPYRPDYAPSAELPFAFTGFSHKMGSLRAWRLGDGEFVLVEGSPNEKPCFTDFQYFLFQRGAAPPEPATDHEANLAREAQDAQNDRALEAWTSRIFWEAARRQRSDAPYCGLYLGKDESKGDVAVNTLSGLAPIGDPRHAEPQFKGQGTLYLEQWRKFMDAGIPRAALLYGPPGGGKSTLLRDAAALLGERNLVLHPWNTNERLRPMIKGLKADVLILEDLDRWDYDDLCSYVMPLLEAKAARLVLATCNDFLKLPQALRRPGRFDQMIEILAPDRDGRRDIMLRHAKGLGVEVPADAQDRLLTWSDGKTGAFLCEMVTRGAVLGWERADIFPPLDATHLQVEQPEEAEADRKRSRNRPLEAAKSSP